MDIQADLDEHKWCLHIFHVHGGRLRWRDHGLFHTLSEISSYLSTMGNPLIELHYLTPECDLIIYNNDKAYRLLNNNKVINKIFMLSW